MLSDFLLLVLRSLGLYFSYFKLMSWITPFIFWIVDYDFESLALNDFGDYPFPFTGWVLNVFSFFLWSGVMISSGPADEV